MPPPGRSRDTLLLRGLHLLTLAVHVIGEPLPASSSYVHPPGDSDGRGSSGAKAGGGGAAGGEEDWKGAPWYKAGFGDGGGPRSDVEVFCGVMMEPIVLPPEELQAAAVSRGGGDEKVGVTVEEMR